MASSDAHHARAGELLAECRQVRARLYSTWEVVGETVTLLTYRLKPQAGIDFLKRIRPELLLVPTTLAVLEEAERVFTRQVGRQRLSFCDAISFVVVSAVLGAIPCLSFDRDFARLGLTVIR